MYNYDNYPRPAGYFTTVDGAQLPWFEYGKTNAKETIFFLNGLTCNQFNIAKVIRGLESKFRIVTFDYRGQGLAWRERYPVVTVDAVIADIDAFHAHLGKIPVHLFGYSMGCQLAVEWNFRNNKHIESVVLLMGIYGNIFSTFMNLGIFAPIVNVTVDFFPFLKPFYKIAWRSAHSMPYALRVALGRGAMLNPDLVAEHELRPFLDQLRELDFEYLLRMSHAIHHHTNEGQYHKIEKPCLIISGENDLFASPIHSERVHQAVSASWYFAIPRGTHNAVLENATDIVAFIEDFFSEKMRRVSHR